MLDWILPPLAIVLWVVGFGCYFYHRRIGEFWDRFRKPKNGDRS